MWITWKVIVRETCFCEKIQADFTLSWVFQKYFNFVPMLGSRNVDHVKSDCSWDKFLWKNSGGLHTFMRFSKIFQLCTHARFTKCGSREKWLFQHHSFISFSELLIFCIHARIMEYVSIKKSFLMKMFFVEKLRRTSQFLENFKINLSSHPTIAIKKY